MDLRLAGEVVVAAAAFWGAILSTVEARARRRETRPQLRVRLGIEPMTEQTPEGERRFTDVLTLRAENAGLRPVIVDGFGFVARHPRLLPTQAVNQHGRGVVVLGPYRFTAHHAHGAEQLPIEVRPGDHHLIWLEPMDLTSLRSHLLQRGLPPKIKLRGMVRDRVNARYTSKALTVDLNMWGASGASMDRIEPLPW